MPSGVIIGILFPNLTLLTKPFAESIVICMLTVSIFRLDPTEILVTLARIKLILFGTSFILVIIPLLIFLFAHLVHTPIELITILVAWGSCPPLVSMPGLAILIGLNGTFLIILLGATLIFTVTLPILLSVLTENGIDIDPLNMSIKLIIIVGLCLLATAFSKAFRKFPGKKDRPFS